MIHSMTAYARAEVTGDWGLAVWEVRSVNHRYLELHFKLPDNLRDIESKLREMARGLVTRGKLDCFLKLELSKKWVDGIKLDLGLAEQLVSAGQEIAKLLPQPQAISPFEVLNWPEVIRSDCLDMAEIGQAVSNAFKQTVASLAKVRNREGNQLKELLLSKLDKMQQELQDIEKRLPEVVIQTKNRLRQRLSECQAELDQNRLEQEMVFMVQKMDVAEEVDRLDTHIKEVYRVINKGGSIGRRLDFLMQEMNREANTLAAKSVDATVTRSAVELKVLIEQIREQVQNIE